MRARLRGWFDRAFPGEPQPRPLFPYELIAQHPNPLGMLRRAKAAHPHSMPVGVNRRHEMIYTKAETTFVGVGPARALGGKSASISVPVLMEHDGPAVVMSLRTDALRATVALRSLRGPVSMFNPDGLRLPAGVQEKRWSLLVGADDLDFALTTCRAFVKSAGSIASTAEDAAEHNHFLEQGGTVLGVTCHFAAMTGKPFNFVKGLSETGDLKGYDDMLGVMSYWEDQRPYRMLSGILSMPGDRERGSILTTLNVAMSAYQTDAAMASTVNPNLDPTKMITGSVTEPNPWLWVHDPKEPGKGSGQTLYLIAGEQPIAAAINVAIVTQMIEARIRLYRDDEEAGDTDAHPDVLFCLDEMANMPLPQLPTLLAAPGRGCLFTGMLQDFSQLSKWGVAGPSMLTQMQQLAIFRGERVRDTLQLIESICPTIPVERVINSGQHEGSALGASATPERLPGIPAYRIYSGVNDDPTTVLYLGADGTPPDWIHIRPYYSDPMLLNAQVKSLWHMTHSLDAKDDRRLLPIPNLDRDGTGSALPAAGGPALLKQYQEVKALLRPATSAGRAAA